MNLFIICFISAVLLYVLTLPFIGKRSAKKKESTFKTIDVMMDGDYFVESIRNNRLAQIYGLEKEGN